MTELQILNECNQRGKVWILSNINISNLTFSYDGSFENIFENININIDSSWKLGLIGRNGRGKTTLLNLLMNKYEFTGSISSKVTFSYFPYEVADEEANVIDIIGDDWRIYRELSLLKVPEDIIYRQFNTLSQGEKTKVLLAYMFIKEDNFLLIDEPTNHLDIDARKILSDYLRQKQGFILVSHDRYFLDNCIEYIMSINKTNIEIVSGNFTTWNENKQSIDNFELEQNNKLKGEIKRLSATAKEKSMWSDRIEKTKYNTKNSGLRPDRGYIGHKAAKMMKRSKSIEKRVESQIAQKEALLKNIENAEELKILPLKFHSNHLIYGDKISVFYEDYNVLNKLDFEISQGQKINVKGRNGSGKSSLLKLIMDENIQYTGEFYKASGLIISYVPQDTSFLQGKLSDFEQEAQIDVSLFRAILRKLDFNRESFERPIETYSAGQKKKVLIAKSLSQKAHVYIWDEPLNYIDVLSRIQIENLVKTSDMTLVFVEHDKIFCENIADATIILDK